MDSRYGNNHLDEKNFPFFFSSQVIIPFILGSILSIAYFIPNIQFQQKYSWIDLTLILFLIFKNTTDTESIYFESDETPKIMISKPLVVMAFLLYFSLRLLLNRSHHFFLIIPTEVGLSGYTVSYWITN